MPSAVLAIMVSPMLADFPTTFNSCINYSLLSCCSTHVLWLWQHPERISTFVQLPCECTLLVEGIRPVLPLICNTPYGKRIQNKLQREQMDKFEGYRSQQMSRARKTDFTRFRACRYCTARAWLLWAPVMALLELCMMVLSTHFSIASIPGCAKREEITSWIPYFYLSQSLPALFALDLCLVWRNTDYFLCWFLCL